jgi:hypothetical protein
MVSRNADTTSVGLMRISKNCLYESPYTVTGSIKLAGLEIAPKGICTDSVNGTW